jgi:hypothetical protein
MYKCSLFYAEYDEPIVRPLSRLDLYADSNTYFVCVIWVKSPSRLYGLDLFLLSIDKGITGYRANSLETSGWRASVRVSKSPHVLETANESRGECTNKRGNKRASQLTINILLNRTNCHKFLPKNCNNFHTFHSHYNFIGMCASFCTFLC